MRRLMRPRFGGKKRRGGVREHPVHGVAFRAEAGVGVEATGA